MSTHLVVLGNGFDIDCGLPTQYADFLRFVSLVQTMHDLDTSKRIARIRDWCGSLRIAEVRDEMKSLLVKAFCDGDDAQLNAWDDLITNNCWIEYFKKAQVDSGWVDFESEIAHLVQLVEDAVYKNPNRFESLDRKIVFLGKHAKTCAELNLFLEDAMGLRETNSTMDGIPATYYSGSTDGGDTFGTLRNRMLKDLRKVILALQKYLHDFVEQVSVDTLNAVMTDGVKHLQEDLARASNRYVLSFNYTHTFRRLFKKRYAAEAKGTTYCYVHGEAQGGTVAREDCNMVLGIDEYRTGENKSKNLGFIAFRKYYQRIVGGNDGSYASWPTEFLMNPGNASLAIYGHSLAVTDKEVLERFILTPNMRIVCYHHNKEALGQCVANLVELLGMDNLVELTGGNDPALVFCPQ